MSDHDQRPDSPIWRQTVGTVWRVEKETWREAALIGLVGGVIGAWAGRLVFRHKTQKPVFTIVLVIAGLLWGAIAVWALLG